MNAPAPIPISVFRKVNDGMRQGTQALAELRGCADRIHAAGRRTVEACIEIGAELVKAREITRGAWQGGTQVGEWHRFLDETLQMPRRQADRFIDVFEKYGGVPRGTPLPNVPFRVLAELAAPEADQEVVAQLEEKIARGERVTVRQVVKAKGPEAPIEPYNTNTLRKVELAEAEKRRLYALLVPSVNEDFIDQLDMAKVLAASNAEELQHYIRKCTTIIRAYGRLRRLCRRVAP